MTVKDLALVWPYLLLGLVLIQRIVELAWSERNRRELLKRRGREIGRAPLSAVHPAARLMARRHVSCSSSPAYL